jgi:hypothetical protein
VYDEAQRAWDAERVRGKRGHEASEPEDFLRLGARMDGWAMMVGLIVAISDELDLTTSLRSHLAEDVQTWVRQLLDGDLVAAAQTAEVVAGQRFDMYVTRDLEAARAYVRERYAGNQEKRYGLLASSKAKSLPAYGVRNEFNFTKVLKEGPWYNDPPESPLSCCALHDVATEFACQGLELDFPIVAWGSDLKWNGAQWASPPQLKSKAHDPHRLRLNSYRVLLSRGRDGFVVFVPPEEQMETTFQAIREARVKRF